MGGRSDPTDTKARPDRTPPPPAILNALLTLSVPLSMMGALHVAGTAAPFGPAWTLATIAFGLLFLCNYSIIHEACHAKLQSDRRLNYVSGAFAAMFFPIPYTLISKTHIGHHLRNRTDDELFDAYYPGDDLFSKRVRWYGLLLGAHYFLLSASNILVLVLPRQIILRLFGKDETYGRYVEAAFRPAWLRRMRIEAAVILALATAFFSRLDAVATFPAIYLGVFLWSTNQYLAHAFSNRDLTHGAFNLTGAGPIGWVLLNRQYDLNHHRHPFLPWIHLADPPSAPGETRNYYRQWLKLWRGPRPVASLPQSPSPE